MPRQSVPLVSLVVRSMGRPELAEALAAAGAQTHPRLCIVVVDATGGRHPAVPSRAGPHPVVFVAGTAPRKRPVAANAGLDAANGDYVGFLDDDDLLLPDHLAGLAGALDAEPGVDLAFARAREIRERGQARSVGHARVSLLSLIEECFFPPCAALFRRSLLAHCRFDESLDEAEDWDFWIQVARRSVLRFVPQETAIYRADRGRSTMTTGERAGANRWRDAVQAKWSATRRELVAKVDAAFDVTLARAEHGDWDAAARAADGVLALHPFHAGALNVRGTCQAMRGDFEASRADFVDALDCAPDDSTSLFNLAQANQRLDRRAEAAALYRRLLVVEPAHPHARARLDAL